MTKNLVRDASGALAFLTDCTLATVRKLAMSKSASKAELVRQVIIAQAGIDSMIQFGVDCSNGRATEVVALGGSVETWAEQFKP
ncbi:hypothetical protein [Pseudomonas sp. EMN2]|uniref:hypothetical protein n=1 Tax=Pseudomonas sp. EMN2 TaxID=2615212 RepID=UPI00129AA69A|nr:hypothetical protein [Pseudomonas sp. EMN2]